jgi:hypothetical protein
MKLKLPSLVAIISLALVMLAAGHATTVTPSIRAIRVHMFENKTGRLSEDILASSSPSRWNSFAGPQAADAALVVVEVDGQPSGVYTGRLGGLPALGLRLIANERGRKQPLLDAWRRLPVLSEDGRAYVAFLIRPGGCAPIQLSASVTGLKTTASSSKSATVPMACGE